MKVQSTINPSKFYIRKIGLGVAHVKLRNNINEVEHEVEDGELDSIFEFDEVEIQISDRVNLDDYILNNFESLFQMGLSEESEIEQLSVNDKLDELEGTIAELTMLIASSIGGM